MTLRDSITYPQTVRLAARNTAISASEIRTERPRRCTGNAPESMSLRTVRVDVLKSSATSLMVRSLVSAGLERRLFRCLEICEIIFATFRSACVRTSPATQAAGSLERRGADRGLRYTCKQKRAGLLSGYFGIPTTSNFPFVSIPGRNGNLSERALKLLASQLTLNQRVQGSSPCAPTKQNQALRSVLAQFHMFAICAEAVPESGSRTSRCRDVLSDLAARPVLFLHLLKLAPGALLFSIYARSRFALKIAAVQKTQRYRATILLFLAGSWLIEFRALGGRVAG